MSLPIPETITAEVIAIIADESGISEEDLLSELLDNKFTLAEANLDSLIILDTFFAIDKAFGVRLPQEEWSQLSIGGIYEDDNGEVLYTLQSIVKEIQKQLPPPTEMA